MFGFEQANKYTVLDQDGNTVLTTFANPPFSRPVLTAFQTAKLARVSAPSRKPGRGPLVFCSAPSKRCAKIDLKRLHVNLLLSH